MIKIINYGSEALPIPSLSLCLSHSLYASCLFFLSLTHTCTYTPQTINSSLWVKVKSLSSVRLLVTPWTAAYQAPPPMEFSRQEYWRGLPLPSLKLCATQRVYHSNKKEAIFIVSEFYNLMHKGQKKISMGIFKYNFKGERSLLRWWISYFNRQ